MVVVLEARIKQVILPHPVDAEVLTGKSLTLKSGLLEEPDRWRVSGNACSLDSMQPQRSEGEWYHGAYRRRNNPLASMVLAHRRPEAASLRATTTDVGERKTSDQDIVALAEDEERIGEIAALVLEIALDAAAK